MCRERSLVDSLQIRLEQHNRNLEEKVKDRTEELETQRAKADDLLYQMLPKSVAEKLKRQSVSNI